MLNAADLRSSIGQNLIVERLLLNEIRVDLPSPLQGGWRNSMVAIEQTAITRAPTPTIAFCNTVSREVMIENKVCSDVCRCMKSETKIHVGSGLISQ